VEPLRTLHHADSWRTAGASFSILLLLLLVWRGRHGHWKWRSI
jgi:hypothetical protein